MTGSDRSYSAWRPMVRTGGLALPVLACGIHIYLVNHFNFTQDDAYITFRYANNFLQDYGLVYNIGERIEGFTNFLWTMIIIVGRRFGIDYVFFSKMLGTFFGIGTITLTFLTARYLFGRAATVARTVLPGTCTLLLAATYPFAYWTVAGLETTPFAFAVLLAVYSYLRRSRLVAAALVIATLLRPEGILIFLFIVLYDLIAHRRMTGLAGLTILTYLIYLAPFAFFKLLYYGSLLPNPFYAKTTFTFQQVVYGLDYAGRFFWHYFGAGVFLVPAVVAYRKIPAIRFPLLFVLVYTIYIIVIGGDVLKVHRFFVPILPLIVLTAVLGIHSMLNRKALYVLPLIFLLAWQVIVPRPYVAQFRAAEKALAWKMDVLARNLMAVDSTNFSVAASTIGILGYRLAGHTIIDLLGLTDSTVARHPEPPIEGLETTWRESHFNTPYILSRQPDYILFSTGFRPSAPAERALFLYRGFLKSYRTIGFYTGSRPHPVFKRRLPVAGPIERDVDVGFVQNLTRGIVLLNQGRDLPEALDAFDEAARLLADTTYPYLYNYMALTCARMNQFDSTEALYGKMVTVDSLAYEGIMALCLDACSRRHADAYQAFRGWLARLTPWLVPRVDSLCRATAGSPPD